MTARTALLTLVFTFAACNAPQSSGPVDPDTGSEGSPPKEAASPGPGPATGGGALAVSGPYTHKSLSLYLIHGADQVELANFLTLEEAVAQGKVKVHETGSVQQLAIENLSDEPVYVQSGDVVKGGKQDRVFKPDLVVLPHSGKVSIASFCVEQGRWSRRGTEDVRAFAVAGNVLPSRGLKIAAKSSRSQQEVWKEVEEYQSALSGKISGVRADISATSLQLTLENEKLTETVKEFVSALEDIVNGKGDVVGFAFAVDGKLNSADSYASANLFQKLWPKLLRAAAQEAIASGKTQEFTAPAAQDVESWLAGAAKGKTSRKDDIGTTLMETREDEKTFYFETLDKDGNRLHRNVLAR